MHFFFGIVHDEIACLLLGTVFEGNAVFKCCFMASAIYEASV